MTANAPRPFWRVKTLEAMNAAEWESLCDGCGRCCTIKLEDEDTGEIEDTHLACRLLDRRAVRCRDYANRSAQVPGCLKLTPALAGSIAWLPETCAYRRVAQGQDLPDWHYLRCGDRDAVHRAGASVRGTLVPETAVPEEDWDLWTTATNTCTGGCRSLNDSKKLAQDAK